MPDPSVPPPDRFVPRSTLLKGAGPARLLVDGKPFLILGAELHNSSSASADSIRTAFSALEGRHVNTVLAPVSWESIEPTEGQFDFSLVDDLLRTARICGYHLILLWFGSWKNGKSTYVPAWVKREQMRFPRAHIAKTSGTGPIEHLSPFAASSRDSDATAFVRLMEHVRQVDSEHGTVLMVQIENEVGILGDSRDRSPAADAAFASRVPQSVISALDGPTSLRIAKAWNQRGRQTEGSWAIVFGESDTTDEAFMAHAYASYIEVIAERGRAAYKIPMFVNAWLDSEIELPGFALAGGQRPGSYPSGGPLPHVASIWLAVAPTIDLLAPDLYFGNTDAICTAFGVASRGLFLPETRRDTHGAALAFEAIGQHGAIGVSPFGVDSFEPDEGTELRDAYALLTSVAARLHEGREHGGVRGFQVSSSRPQRTLSFGDIDLVVTQFIRFGDSPSDDLGYGLVIRLEPYVFLVAGRGIRIEARNTSNRSIGILTARELLPLDLSTSRIVNGDETQGGSAIVHQPLGFRNRGPFPIPASTLGTGLTIVEYYAYGER